MAGLWAEKRIRRRAARAFSLIEVMIALLVVAIAMVGLLRLQVVSIRVTDRAAQLSRATLLADAKMAEALAQDKTETGSAEGRVDEEGRKPLRWRVTVSAASPKGLEDAGVKDLRQVSVVVTWEDGAAEKRVQLVTFKGDRQAAERSTSEAERRSATPAR